MSDATTIAIVGLATTAGVGVAGHVTGFVTGLLDRREARRSTREDELRTVIEDAAIRLTEALALLNDTEQASNRPGAGNVPLAVPDETHAALIYQLQQLHLNEDKLQIRLGPDAPECRHFNAAMQAWDRAALGPNGIVNVQRDPFRWGHDQIAANASSKEFRTAAASRLSPDASRRTRRRAKRK